MLREKVLKTIKKYKMLQKGDKVVIGVSGGPDSVTLSHILASLKNELDISLFVAHLNHMFRPVEAEKEVRFVREMANHLSLPVFIKHENVPEYIREKKISKEAGAREIRYVFFNEISQKVSANKIALGHTLDDQAETFLLNLFRGSGHTGLGGILPVHDKYIHPLIECSREEALSYLEENKLGYCIDSSNLEPVFQRNKIRLELLPQLIKDYNPNIKEILFRTSLILQEEDLYLENQAQRYLPRVLRIDQKGLLGEGKEVVLLIKEFEKVPPALKPKILREAFRRVKGDLLQLSFVHIEDLLNLIDEKHSGSSLDLPGEITALKEYRKIRIRKGKIPTRESTQYTIKKTILNRNKPLFFYRATHDTAYFDADKVGSSFFVRMRKPGDRFYPQGAKGTRKLSDFFIDQKVSREMREKIPLLLANLKSEPSYKKKIIWVVGYRVNEEVKVTHQTQKVLKVEIFRKI